MRKVVASRSPQQFRWRSSEQLQMVVSGYALAFGLTLVAGGRLGDASGRRRLMLVGLTGFIVSSAAVGLAPTAGLVVAARLSGPTVAISSAVGPVLGHQTVESRRPLRP